MKGNMARFFIAAVVEIGVWFVAHTIVILSDGLRDERVPSDVAVVMGTGIDKDGRLTPRLEARLKTGAEVWREGLAPVIVTSGAVDRNGHDEAVMMRDALIGMGVPARDVIADSGGATSYDTAKDVSALMRERGWTNVIVVSQYYHISRTRYAFERFGVEHVAGIHAKYFDLRDLWSIVREFPAFYVYVFKNYDVTNSVTNRAGVR